MAYDDNIATRWESIQGIDPQWVYFDLGEEKYINQTIIDWEPAYSRRYKIDVSNDLAIWTTVASNTNALGLPDHWKQTNQFSYVKARYVRLYSFERATAFGVSFWEIDINLKRLTNFTSPIVSIGSFNPPYGRIGESVTITGTGFGSTQESGSVWFGDLEVTDYDSWTDNSIQVKVPIGAVTAPIKVTNKCDSGEITVTDFYIGSNIIYVDKDNITGPWYGVSWNTAYTSINDAMADFADGTNNTILIADGIYNESIHLQTQHSGKRGYTNTIKGYTNGVVIDAEGNAENVIHLTTVEFIKIENLVVTGGTNDGIRLFLSNSNIIKRVVSYKNGRVGAGSGIAVQGGWENLIINCTVWSNTYGMYFTSDNNYIRNSIIQQNFNAGIQSGINNTFDYNNVWGNVGPSYAGGAAPGVNSISNDSLFASVVPGTVDFLHLSGLSPCINMGDPSDPIPPGGGTRVDIGAYEVTGTTSAEVAAFKILNSIKLQGIDVNPIPGAMLEYIISYSNKGPDAALNAFVYDKLCSDVTYFTQQAAAGWTLEWSTNTDPDNSWGSVDYKSSRPLKSDIKWIRWKRTVLPNAESGYFIYKVIIK